MAKKMLCMMAGYDEITEQRLAMMQKALYEKGYIGTHTKNLPQHITLGTFPIEQESELIRLMTRVANETIPFDITFNHIGVFGGSKVLFVAPDPNTRLLHLKEQFGDSFNWTPHTTMLIDEPGIIYEALPLLANAFEAFQGQVQMIYLYEFWPARHILSLPLKQ